MNLSDLQKNLESIEARLTAIENNKSSHLTTQPTVFKSEEKSPEKKALTKPMSGNWLGVVGSICFVLAAGFIIELSIESGWLTHQKQLGLATLLGLALFAAGILLSTADKIYASFLPAAGATILYLTCFAAYQYYLLISFQTVIAITSIVSGLSIWFYIRFKHDIYAIIAAVGAYIAPVVSDVNTNAIFTLYYFIICSLTFATLSILVRSRILTVISSYLAFSITAFVGLNLNQNELIAIILLVNFLIFSMGTYFHTQLTQQEMTEIESWSFFPVLLIFYATVFYYISRIHPALAPWVSLGAAALLIGLYLSAKNWIPERHFSSRSMLFTFVTMVCFHSIYLELLPSIIKPWLFPFIVLGINPISSKSTPNPINTVFVIPLIALSLILGIEYLNILSHLLNTIHFRWAVVAMASLASLWYVFITHRTQWIQKEEYSYALLAATHLLAIACLYQLTTHYGSLAVSSSWLLYSLIVLGFAYIQNDIVVAKSVLIILFFAAGKALLYDAASTPTIIRTLCLILTGIVLYASGFVIRKMTRWGNKKTG